MDGAKHTTDTPEALDDKYIFNFLQRKLESQRIRRILWIVSFGIFDFHKIDNFINLKVITKTWKTDTFIMLM